MASSASSPRHYDSDLTDAQWALIEPLLPPPSPVGRRSTRAGRWSTRSSTWCAPGCAWRLLPHEFPPWQTVFWCFRRCRADGTLDRLHDVLRDRIRDADGRDPMASAAIEGAQ